MSCIMVMSYILLMDEIPHHLGYLRPCTYWGTLDNHCCEGFKVHQQHDFNIRRGHGVSIYKFRLCNGHTLIIVVILS